MRKSKSPPKKAQAKRRVAKKATRKRTRKQLVVFSRRNFLFFALFCVCIAGFYRIFNKDSVPLALEYRLLKQDVRDAMEENDFKVSMVGDVMLGGTSEEIFDRYGYEHAFKQTRKLLKRSDIVFGNLEGPLTDRGTPDPEKTFSFRSKPKSAAAALAYGGFNILSLANNHSLDYGTEGLVQTIESIGEHRISHVGAGMNETEARQHRMMYINGRRVAFLAYSLTLPESFWANETNPGTAFGKIEHIQEDIAAAKCAADVVLVSMHWGQESSTELQPYQVFVGRAIIDAGATIVIGHHPHILQAVERYKNGAILYSLGNFAFGSYSNKVDNSVVAQAYFKDNRLAKIRFWPIYVRNVDVVFQSKLLHGKRAENAINHLRKLSLDRATEIDMDEGAGVLRFDP